MLELLLLLPAAGLPLPAPAVPAALVRQADAVPGAAELRVRARANAFAGGRATGTGSVGGVDHRLLLVADGAGHARVDLEGPLGVARGVDEAGVWGCDARAGVPYEVGLWSGDLQRAWISAWTGDWAREGAALEVEATDEPAVVRLVSPRSSFEGRLALDPGTGLARELSVSNFGGTRSWRFEDVRDGLARRLVGTDVTGHAQTWTLTAVEGGGAGDLGRPERRPTLTEIDPEAEPRLEVRQAHSGHLLVHPYVDGQDAGWWVFDSGASNATIDPAAADRLGLESFGRGYTAGAGLQTNDTVYRRAGALELGPLLLLEPVFTELPTPIPGVNGILGFDVLVQVVAEIDMHAPSIALHDPTTYELPEEGRWEELVLHLRHPHARASFEGGHEGLFRLDTGAGELGVVFHTPAVRRLDLLAGRETTPVEALGAGGAIHLRVGKVAWFEIGGRRIEDAPAAFSLDEGGALADPDSLGNLGGGVLPFRLVLDYGGGRLAFLPREEPR